MPVQKFKTKPIKNAAKIEPSNYFVIFDDYLQPKSQLIFSEKTRDLLEFSGAHWKPPTLNESIREKWRLLAKKFTQQRVVKVKPLNNLVIDTKKLNIQQKALKPKSGFQIYCELASVHGLHYLTGASKWQRIFWCFILCSMLTLSIYTLWNSLSLNADNPTILYTDTKTGIFWGKTFPAITLCNFNHISKKKLNDLLMKNFSSETADQIRPLIPYVLYSALPVNATPADYRSLHRLLTSANYTHSDFLEKISPDCESQLIRCKILAQVHPCNVLFQRVRTQHGFCCSFNFNAIINGNQTAEELSIHSNRFGPKWGLSVLLDPQVEDYYASRNKFGGYQVYAHNGYDFLNINDPHQLVLPGYSIHIHTAPFITLATTLLKNQDLHLRRCYLRNERKLLAFAEYTQQNCFSECRSREVLTSCGCVPPLWPRAENWTVCTLLEASCVMAQIGKIDVFLYRN
ncbi:pickpocket protein 11-like [Bactrocera dorsalis]|uniref:Pickpocket protein 11-like n=1 Tax=Bactrocera dorsalis TaxID=27457 RepID=A0ABM3K6P2_BACDO|nr:pickpocket protein 11-like [Bactrocera dorsalis]